MENLEQYDMNSLAKYYKDTRDYIKAVEEQTATELEPHKKIIEELEVEMTRRLNEDGATSMKTPSGTIVKSVTTNFNISDSQAFAEFVKENDLVHLYQSRVSSTELKAYILEHNNELPPGISAFSKTKTTVRKA